MNKEGHYLVAGPDWKGSAPNGIKRIVSPTNLIWVIGRTMYYGRDDIETVKAIQKQITFTPLSQFKVRG